jgi:hypothetical protein
MGPLASLPLEFLLDIPSSREHIHGMDKPMDPLGLRHVLLNSTSFKKGDVFLGILCALISIGQFKFGDGMEAHLYKLGYLLPGLNIRSMGHPPPRQGPSSHNIHGLKYLLYRDNLLHLDQECLHWPSTIKPQGVRKFRPYPSHCICAPRASPCSHLINHILPSIQGILRINVIRLDTPPT